MKYSIYSFLCLLFFWSCQAEATQSQPPAPEAENDAFISNIDVGDLDSKESLANEDTMKIKRTRVLVMPCSNGYDYGTYSFDLDPLLSRALKQFDNFDVMEFPYKLMGGSGYHGVFDKEHCDQILEKVKVDFIIMNRIKGSLKVPKNQGDFSWGYQTRVLKTKSMEQFNSIEASRLEFYEDIEKNIDASIEELVALMML